MKNLFKVAKFKFLCLGKSWLWVENAIISFLSEPRLLVSAGLWLSFLAPNCPETVVSHSSINLTHRSPALWVLAKAVVSKYCGQGILRLYQSRSISGCVGLTRSCMERCSLNFAFGWKLMLKPCVFVIEPESLIFLSWLISASIKQLKHGQHHSNHQLLLSASYCRNLVPADLLSLDPTPASISDLFSPGGCFLELLRRVPGPRPAHGLPWVQALPVVSGFVSWDFTSLS